MKKVNVKNMSRHELEVFMESIGEKKFRGKQIFSWIYKGAGSFDEMTNLSAALREKLKETAYLENLYPLQIQTSQRDGTRKYLFRLKDGNAVESVFMKYKYGNTACISSQAGCRMRCGFCASGIHGLERNLTAAEMVDQIISMERDTGERIGHVVIMGTGEPFDNYEHLLSFIDLIHSEDGLNISLRNITVSTCGLIPKLRQFSSDYPQVNVAVSLHAPNNAIRDQLMPINKKYPIEELITACKDHTKKTSRRITFEYILIQGINDEETHANQLAALLRGMLCHVNLIPMNQVSEKKIFGSGKKKAEQFQHILKAKGIEVTLRRELGSDIQAACGQLRLDRESGKNPE